MTPSKTPSPEKPVFSMLVARQLDTLTTGNGAYLMVLLRAARKAGMEVRIVFAPRRTFGNRPWMTLHPAFRDISSEIVLPGALRRGDRYWSLSPVVWARFGVRLVQETLRRLKMDLGSLTRVSSLLGAPLSAAEAAELAHATDRLPGDIAVAEYSSLGPVLPLLKAQTRKAALMHDLFSLRAAAFRSRGEKPDHFDITLKDEAARVSAADALFYASANEMAEISPLLPSASHIWLRPDAPDFGPVPVTDAPARAVFLGTRHAGNTDAMKHLVDDIWPLVRQRAPAAELWIAGSICQDLNPDQASAPGVKPLGRVASLADLGGANSIGLAPTRIASGVSIKVAEYLSLGMTCVAYPVALEGFGDALNDLVDVTADKQAFADRIVDLLNDTPLRKQRAARAAAEAPARLDNLETVTYLRG